MFVPARHSVPLRLNVSALSPTESQVLPTDSVSVAVQVWTVSRLVVLQFLQRCHTNHIFEVDKYMRHKRNTL